MTFKRTLEIMEQKGFTPDGAAAVYYTNGVVQLTRVDDMRTEGVADYRIAARRLPYERGLRALVFKNPIAAATYAERIVIPALLAGRDSP